MTAPTPFPAADYRPGSQLATGAYPGTRRLSIQIAEMVPSHRLGNTAATTVGFLPLRSSPHLSRSSKHQPKHNIRGGCSERDETIPVRVGNDADLRAERVDRLPPMRSALRLPLVGLALLGRHPSVRSPGVPVAFKFGARTSEHEPKEFPDDGNLTAQRIKLTARGGNAKG